MRIGFLTGKAISRIQDCDLHPFKKSMYFKATGLKKRTCKMDMSYAEETIRSQAILESSRYGDKVTTIGVVSTINDLRGEVDISAGTGSTSYQRTL
jgi:hypothetical protein